MSKIYIVSGIGPGFGGVGKVVEFLEKYSSDEFQVIAPMNLNIRNKFFKSLVEYFFIKPIFRIRLFFLINKNVILVHFNSLGFFISKYLINFSKNIEIYIMDNSFFCVSAYNYKAGDTKECTLCLGGNFKNSTLFSCRTMPRVHSRKSYINFQKFLLEKKDKIRFLTLSKANSVLLQEHFGKDINHSALYFLTEDFKNYYEKFRLENKSYRYDICFHGNFLEAKGSVYTLKLAEKLQEYSFFLPVKTIPEEFRGLKNISYEEVTWEHGLEEIVGSSKLVLTPSLWSNTPEAATLKSLAINGSVGMVVTKFGFANEFADDEILKLPNEIDEAVEIIKHYLNNEIYKNQKIKGRSSFNRYYAEYTIPYVEKFNIKN